MTTDEKAQTTLDEVNAQAAELARFVALKDEILRLLSSLAEVAYEHNHSTLGNAAEEMVYRVFGLVE